MKQEQRYQPDDGQQHRLAKASENDANQQKVEEMFPGIPIVRGNTPRPLSFNAMISSGGQLREGMRTDSGFLPAFPIQAPLAPPLPEELNDQEEDIALELSDPALISNPEVPDLTSISNQSERALRSIMTLSGFLNMA